MQIKLCYINQHWYVYIYVSDNEAKEVETKTTRHDNNDRGIYRLTKYTHPEVPEFYSFGFMADNPKERPGHGGEWSSNEGNINKVFGVNIWGVAINQMSLSVPFEWLVKLLGEDVDWQDDDIYTKKIVNVKGIENKDHRWVILDDGKWRILEDSSYESMRSMRFSTHR